MSLFNALEVLGTLLLAAIVVEVPLRLVFKVTDRRDVYLIDRRDDAEPVS